ncbi:hypothetical protein HK101_010354 [Irineochytrium annulatum]|nr:hypothetical protein HK101_010354 [Irineochytrium annulatum]
MKSAITAVESDNDKENAYGRRKDVIKRPRSILGEILPAVDTPKKDFGFSRHPNSKATSVRTSETQNTIISVGRVDSPKMSPLLGIARRKSGFGDGDGISFGGSECFSPARTNSKRGGDGGIAGDLRRAGMLASVSARPSTRSSSPPARAGQNGGTVDSDDSFGFKAAEKLATIALPRKPLAHRNMHNVPKLKPVIVQPVVATLSEALSESDSTSSAVAPGQIASPKPMPFEKEMAMLKTKAALKDQRATKAKAKKTLKSRKRTVRNGSDSESELENDTPGLFKKMRGRASTTKAVANKEYVEETKKRKGYFKKIDRYKLEEKLG